jgi:hypothetical protein
MTEGGQTEGPAGFQAPAGFGECFYRDVILRTIGLWSAPPLPLHATWF